VVAHAVEKLERRAGDRGGEEARRLRRHDAALAARDDTNRAANAAEEPERSDPLGREHAAIPAEPPPALGRLDGPLGERLELVVVEDGGEDAATKALEERIPARLDALLPLLRAAGQLGILLRPVALHVRGEDGCDPIASGGCAKRDISAEGVPDDGSALQPEPVEQREEVVLVVPVPVRLAVRAQAMSAKVDRDDPEAAEKRRDAEPVAEVAREPVEKDDRRSVPRVGVGEPVRGWECTTEAVAAIR